MELRLARGPQAFKPLLSSSLKHEIDRKLFEERDSVRSVWRWLVEAQPNSGVSYVMLTRYKKATEAEREQRAAYPRQAEISRDLELLGMIVDRGQVALREGLIPSMAQVLRALELRSQILAQFPDESGALRQEMAAKLQCMADVVLEVVTEDQRVQIVQRLQAIGWT